MMQDPNANPYPAPGQPMMDPNSQPPMNYSAPGQPMMDSNAPPQMYQ